MSDILIVMDCKCRWESFPARQQCLAMELSKYFTVLYLEDSPKAFPGIRNHSERLYIGTGMLCWYDAAYRRNLPLLTIVADMCVNRFSRKFDKVVIWDMENCHSLLTNIKADLRVFDHIDPCFSPDPVEVELFNNRVMNMCKSADMVVASAPALLRDCVKYSENVHLVSNACTQSAANHCPDDLKSIDLVWLGTFDTRIDTVFVRQVCEALPGKSIVLAGNMHSNVVSELRSVRNVQILGPVTSEEGNNLLSCSKYGMIPYKSGYIGDRINPVKLFEYIAHDVVPICLPNQSVDEFNDYIFSSDNVQVWSSVVTGGVLPKLWDERHSFLSQNTWAVRGTQVLNLISKELALCVIDE